jgi:hypothetical protein
MRVKKGQLRRWNVPGDPRAHDKVFITLSSRVSRDRGPRHDLGWGGRHRGEILWTILEDGNIVEGISQMDIHALSEAIDETG